jgi:hypothetical protein
MACRILVAFTSKVPLPASRYGPEQPVFSQVRGTFQFYDTPKNKISNVDVNTPGWCPLLGLVPTGIAKFGGSLMPTEPQDHDILNPLTK